MERTRVKVCCIQSRDEAELAIRLGADCLGLVGEMPSGPGPISDSTIREIASSCPPGVSTFLLTSRTSPDAVVEHVLNAGAAVVQLVDAPPPSTYTALREACPSVRIVQVLHVEGEEVVSEASRIASSVDAILLDSGRPNAAVKELGGTGRTHDWRLSRRVVESVSVPVFLAGGLNPGNVEGAIEGVRPFGVDLCTGVRRDGLLVPELLADFLSSVARADNRGGATQRP